MGGFGNVIGRFWRAALQEEEEEESEKKCRRRREGRSIKTGGREDQKKKWFLVGAFGEPSDRDMAVKLKKVAFLLQSKRPF